MPTDIFSGINVPVVSMIWRYAALDTTEMEQRFTTYPQRPMGDLPGSPNWEAGTGMRSV